MRVLSQEQDWQDLDLVFSGADGRPLDPNWQREVFYMTLKSAGLLTMRF